MKGGVGESCNLRQNKQGTPPGRSSLEGMWIHTDFLPQCRNPSVLPGILHPLKPSRQTSLTFRILCWELRAPYLFMESCWGEKDPTVPLESRKIHGREKNHPEPAQIPAAPSHPQAGPGTSPPWGPAERARLEKNLFKEPFQRTFAKNLCKEPLRRTFLKNLFKELFPSNLSSSSLTACLIHI